MKKNKIIVIFLMIFSLKIGFAQKSLNNYKYIFVPSKFDFLDKADAYRLNTLTRILFKDYGFTVIYESQTYPEDYATNNCMALNADIINSSNFTRTKLQVELRDCRNRVIYTTQVGDSKSKDYKKAYHESLRNAFKSFENVNYTYRPYKTETEKIGASESKDISEVIENKVPLKTPTLIEEKTESTQIIETPDTIVENQEIEILKQVKKDNKKVEESKKAIAENTFFAKKIFNGYQILNNSSNKIMTIFKSGVDGVFIVKGKDAIIYKKNDAWIYSETNETNLITKIINIKF